MGSFRYLAMAGLVMIDSLTWDKSTTNGRVLYIGVFALFAVDAICAAIRKSQAQTNVTINAEKQIVEAVRHD